MRAHHIAAAQGIVLCPLVCVYQSHGLFVGQRCIMRTQGKVLNEVLCRRSRLCLGTGAEMCGCWGHVSAWIEVGHTGEKKIWDTSFFDVWGFRGDL